MHVSVCIYISIAAYLVQQSLKSTRGKEQNPSARRVLVQIAKRGTLLPLTKPRVAPPRSGERAREQAAGPEPGGRSSRPQGASRRGRRRLRGRGAAGRRRAPFSTGAARTAALRPAPLPPTRPPRPRIAPQRRAGCPTCAPSWTPRLPRLACCVFLRGGGWNVSCWSSPSRRGAPCPCRGLLSRQRSPSTSFASPRQRHSWPRSLGPARTPRVARRVPARRQREQLLWKSEELFPEAHRGAVPACFTRGLCNNNISTGCLKAQVCWRLCAPESVNPSVRTRLKCFSDKVPGNPCQKHRHVTGNLSYAKHKGEGEITLR